MATVDDMGFMQSDLILSGIRIEGVGGDVRGNGRDHGLSSNRMIYYIADTHFRHANVIRFCGITSPNGTPRTTFPVNLVY